MGRLFRLAEDRRGCVPISLMNNKSSLIIATGILGLFMGTGSVWAEPVCNTTTSNKCTSEGDACTKTVKTCTTFLPDGHTKIETTTSHDCGPGGPKDCPKSGSGSAAARSHFNRVTATTVKLEETSTPKPKFPVNRVSGVMDKSTLTATPIPSRTTTTQTKSSTPTPTPTPPDRNKKSIKKG